MDKAERGKIGYRCLIDAFGVAYCTNLYLARASELFQGQLSVFTDLFYYSSIDITNA